MSKIFMNKYEQELLNGKWHTTNTESRYIDKVEFDLITSESTLAFFISLGGTEEIYRQQDKITKLISTNPGKTEQAVYEFKHS